MNNTYRNQNNKLFIKNKGNAIENFYDNSLPLMSVKKGLGVNNGRWVVTMTDVQMKDIVAQLEKLYKSLVKQKLITDGQKVYVGNNMRLIKYFNTRKYEIALDI